MNQKFVQGTYSLMYSIYRRYTHTFHIEVGYYIRNEYAEPFDENSYPNPVDITKLYRNVVAHEPHVTVTPINWEGSVTLLILP